MTIEWPGRRGEGPTWHRKGRPMVYVVKMDSVRVDYRSSRSTNRAHPPHLVSEGTRGRRDLINNAGIMAAPRSRDARGLESQLAVKPAANGARPIGSILAG